MTTNFANAGIFLVQTFLGLYLILLLIRFLMQVSRADYYNPICQAVVKLTDPVVNPLRPIIPSFERIDLATFIIALFVQTSAISIIMMLTGNQIFLPAYILWGLVGLASIILDIYFFSLLVMVIASWIAPHSNHPATTLINQLTDPICTPARKLLPPMGGLDFSIILVFVIITLIDSFLIIQPLARALGIPSGLIMGLY